MLRNAFTPVSCSESSGDNVLLNASGSLGEWEMSGETENRASSLLEANPHFRGRGRWVTCRCSNGQLYLEGKLPSFYLKQLAQETLRDLEGIKQIENRIVVADPRGAINGCRS